MGCGDDLRGEKTICKVPNYSLHCSSVQRCSNEKSTLKG